MTDLWDGLRVEDALGTDLLCLLQGLLIPRLGLRVYLRKEVEREKLELALAVLIDVEVQALVVVLEGFLS